MSNPQDLEIKRFIAEQLASGISLSEIQKLVNEKFQTKLTFLDIRILASELENVDWNAHDPKVQAKRKEEKERQAAYSPSSPLIRRRSCTSFGLPGEWQVCSDRPLCRRLGNGQAATLLQSNILLKTCHYHDKISTCYCCAVPVPFQRLYKAFLRY